MLSQRRWLSLVSFVAPLVTLTACPTVDVQPIAMATAVQSKRERGFFCGVSLDRVGIGPGAAPPQDPLAEILVGYANTFRPGADPFPCWDYTGHVFRGAVKFDTDDQAFRDLVPLTTDITLEVDVRPTTLPTIRNGSPSNVCALRFQRATAPWEPGYRIGPAGDASVTLPSQQIHPTRWDLHRLIIENGATVERISVKSLVEDWVSGRVPNHGIVFFHPKDDFEHDNDGCAVYLGNVRLRMHFPDEE